MDPQLSDLSLQDWQRILIGAAPWWMLIEVVARAIVLYVLLLAAMRLMGKRVSAQLSISELVVVLTLGAAVGLPLQAPETGVLCAAVVLLIAVLVQRGISYFSLRSRRIEILTQGGVTILVEDGRLHTEALTQVSMSRDKLFATLRAEEVRQLGELRRVYLEASGQFSLMRWHTPHPGLSLMPDARTLVDGLERDPEHRACASCGHIVGVQVAEKVCRCCQASEWVPAVKSCPG